MKPVCFTLLLLLTCFLSGVSVAQFGPPPGGGPGGPPGGGFGGPQDERRKKTFGAGDEAGSADNQPARGNGKITGLLVDSSTNKPVEYATIALLNSKTGKPIDGTTSDDRGRFSMTKLAPGEYRLQYSFIGYRTKESAMLTIKRGSDLNLGSVTLPADVRTLNEVDVVGQRAMIEEKVDRLVYNADKDLTTKGGDAGDVLRRVPMLSVDLDGNVSLRGSQNIRVLINNKPSTIVAASVADAMKQLPADQIKTVEVITSPSAKYDAEGAGGIINIITKKNTLHGLTLNVDAGAGIRGSNLGLNGSYRQGKLGISLSGNGRAMYNRATSSLEQTTVSNSQSVRSSQQATAFDKPIFGQYTLGLDYDLAKNQSLSANLRYGTRNFVQQQHQLTSLFTDGLLTGTTNRDVDRRDLSNTVDMNVDYLRQFKPQQEWTISAQYSRTNLTNNFYADLLGSALAGGVANELMSRQRNLNTNVNEEKTLQTDYQTPIGKRQLLEFGAKGIMRQVSSSYQYQTAPGASATFVLDPTNPAGSLNYQQTIGAGYVSYTYTSRSKYSIKAGTRYEHTGITAKANDGAVLPIPAYSNLVPSVNVSKTIKNTTLKAAYNRRIQRPGLQQLNPNFNAANPQNIQVGNPLLSPELTDNFELGMGTTLNKTYLNVSLFKRLTNNAIAQLRLPSDTLPGAVITTFQNIGVQRTTGANVFANVSLTPRWSINGGIDGFYVYMQGVAQDAEGQSVTISNTGVSIGGRLMSQLSLSRGWGVQVFSFFRGPMPQLQGRMGSMYMYSLGVRKDLANKRGSVGLTAENFAGQGVQMRSEFHSPQLAQISTMRLLNQNVKITFSYRIGKMTFEQPRRKGRSINNDDVKGEGSGGDAGGGSAPGGGSAAPAGGSPAGGGAPAGPKPASAP